MLLLTTPALAEAAEAAEGFHFTSTEGLIVITNVLLVLVTVAAIYFQGKDSKAHVEHLNDSDNLRSETEQAALLKHENDEEKRLAHIIHEVIAAEHDREEHFEHDHPAISLVKDEPAA